MISKLVRNSFKQIRQIRQIRQIQGKHMYIRRYMGNAKTTQMNHNSIKQTVHNSTNTDTHKSFESIKNTSEQLLSSGVQQAQVLEDYILKSKFHFRLFVGSVLGIGIGSIVFSDNIKSVFVEQTSDLTAATLGDETVLKEGQKLVHNIVSSPETQTLVSDLLYKLIQRPDVQENLKYLVFQVLNDPQTLQVLTNLLGNLVQLPQTQELLANLIHSVFNREDVQGYVKEMVDGVIVDVKIRKSLETQLNDTLMNVLQNPDNVAQLGNSIRGSIGYAVWPWGKAVTTQTEPVVATQTTETETVVATKPVQVVDV